MDFSPGGKRITRLGRNTLRRFWPAMRCFSSTNPMMTPLHISRRQALARLGGGLGYLGLASALQAAGETQSSPVGVPHFPPRAKRVIHLFMNGGPFGPDLFDPKPGLVKFSGQRPE